MPTVPKRSRILPIAGILALPAILLVPGISAAAKAPPDIRVTSLAKQDHISEEAAAQRIGWQDAALPEIPAIARQLGSRFGGAWFAPATGRLTVGVVRGSKPIPRAADLRGVARAGLSAVTGITPVRWPQSALSAGTSALSPAIGKINHGAATGVSLRTVPPENAVEIVVGTGVLSSAQRAFIRHAVKTYGTKVRVRRITGRNLVTPDACTAVDFCDPPLRAGLLTGSDNGVGCTTGPIVRSNSDNKLYVMTAGHCIDEAAGSTSRERFSDGSVHAIGAGHSYLFGGRDDEGLITINNPSGWAPRAEIFVAASSQTTFDATYAVSGTGGSAFGMRVCKAGAYHGTSCGQVIGLNATGPNGIEGLGEADYYGGAGDSGAPVFSGHIVYGIHESHIPTNVNASSTCYYVGITAAADHLNVHVAVGS